MYGAGPVKPRSRLPTDQHGRLHELQRALLALGARHHVVAGNERPASAGNIAALRSDGEDRLQPARRHGNAVESGELMRSA